MGDGMTVLPSGTSLITTAFNPIVELSPMVILPHTFAPAETLTLFPNTGLPYPYF